MTSFMDGYKNDLKWFLLVINLQNGTWIRYKDMHLSIWYLTRNILVNKIVKHNNYNIYKCGSKRLGP